MTKDSEKRKFTVISNPILDYEDKEEYNNEQYRKKRLKSYQTNPLREQFMRFTNEEAGRKFTVEDLLKW